MLDKKKRARKLPGFSSTNAFLPDAIVRGLLHHWKMTASR